MLLFGLRVLCVFKHVFDQHVLCVRLALFGVASLCICVFVCVLVLLFCMA